jgi:protein phosphatase
MVEDDEVSIAHVGDSRAYLYRDGELRLLTSDHSLVEELRRQGRLTDAQAQDHPQRSIITRALGPEEAVEIDTLTVSARPGDVILLTSDGLTTMIKDERVAEILAESETLEDAVDRLVREANEAGGRDNITAVAFRLAEAEGAEAVEGATLVGPSADEVGISGERIRAAADSRERRAAAAAGGTPPHRRWRTAAKVLVAALVVAGIGVGAWLGMRQVYFLGTDEGGRLTLYRGLPYELPLGIDLYSEVYSVPVQVASLPEDRRESAVDHELRGRDDAVSLLNDLENAARTPTEAPVSPGDEGGGQTHGGQAGSGGGKKPSGGNQPSGGQRDNQSG